MADLAPPIESRTLDLPPSCVEFCPADPSYLCVGTYNLEKDEERAQGDTSRPQNRNGSIILFKIENNTVHHVKTLAQPSAILDLHFQPTENRRDRFAVVSSTATLSIFRLALPAAAGGERPAGSASPIELVRVIRIDGNGVDVLFLSCAWHPSIPNIVAVSTSTGSVYVLSLDETNEPSVVATTPVLTHDLEAWTVAFSPFTSPPTAGKQTYSQRSGVPNRNTDVSAQDDTGAALEQLTVTLYSGGDDSCLRYTSCVLPEHVHATANGGNPPHVPYSACKLSDFGAGVTAILPVPVTDADGGHIVITGSYDDHIRVFSITDPARTAGVRRTRCLADQDLGGGVWRLAKMLQTASDDGRQWRVRVLASCMHAGARIVDISSDAPGKCQLSVAARFEEHKSMNYGSDFRLDPEPLCVSTSFYDKLLCLWGGSSRVL